MHEELHQFERNKVWHLVPRPLNGSVIGTKWVYKNKINEEDKIIRNLNKPIRTRSHFRIIEEMNSLALVSQIEPKNTAIALTDESWINVLHEELHQFERNKV